MMEINRTHVGAGIAVVASVLLARAGCNDEVGTVIKGLNGLVENTTSGVEVDSNSDGDDTAKSEELDPQEFTVEVKRDENGNVADDFNYVGAVRDCVESTGKYQCFDSVSGDSTCYKENPEEGQVPVMISNDPLYILDYTGTNQFIRVEAGKSVNLSCSELDKNDPTAYQAALNSACNSVIDGMEMQFSEGDVDHKRDGDYEDLQTQVALYPDLREGTDAIFESLNEAGIETKDLGGNMFSFDIGHGGTGRIYGEITGLSQNEDEVDELAVVYRVMFDDHVSTRSEDVDEAISNAVMFRDYYLSGLQE